MTITTKNAYSTKPLYDYSFDDSWEPPKEFKAKNLIEINNEFFKKHTAEQEVALKQLDPNRFKLFIAKSYPKLLSFEYQTLIWVMVNLVGLSYFQKNFKRENLLLTGAVCGVGVISMILLPILINFLAKYFFSKPIEQKHLEEAFLELKRNPMFLNLYQKLSPENKPVEMKVVGESAFGLSLSRAQVWYAEDKSLIEIWDGHRSIKEILANPLKTWTLYDTQSNLALWGGNPLSSLLFEYLNAMQQNTMANLHVQKDSMPKKDYCLLKEYIEHETVIATDQILSYGVKCLGWDFSWFKGHRYLDKILFLSEEFNESFKGRWKELSQRGLGYWAHVDTYAKDWYNGQTLSGQELIDEIKNSPIKEGLPVNWKEESQQAIKICETLSFPEIDISYPTFNNSEIKEQLEPFFQIHWFYKEIQCAFFIDHIFKDLEKINEQTLVDFSKDYKGRFLLHLIQDYLADTKQDNQELTVELFKKTLIALSQEKHRYAKVRWIMGE